MAATLPNVLVTTDWVAQHATDAGVRVVEVDVDTTAYDQGHVPGAVGWNWTTQLCDTLVRDIVPSVRDTFKHPRELKNLEEAATAYIAWWNHTAPGAYDAFSKRIRG